MTKYEIRTLKKFADDAEAIITKIQELKEQMDTLKETCQETWDSRSERWQESEKGEEAQDKIDNLDGLSDYLDTTESELANFIDDIANDFE